MMSTSGGIIVKDIPRGITIEVIKQYFFARGGAINEVRFYEDGKKAFVKFEDSKGVLCRVSFVRNQALFIMLPDE